MRTICGQFVIKIIFFKTRFGHSFSYVWLTKKGSMEDIRQLTYPFINIFGLCLCVRQYYIFQLRKNRLAQELAQHLSPRCIKSSGVWLEYQVIWKDCKVIFYDPWRCTCYIYIGNTPIILIIKISHINATYLNSMPKYDILHS